MHIGHSTTFETCLCIPSALFLQCSCVSFLPPDGLVVLPALSPECGRQPQPPGCLAPQEPGPEVGAQSQRLPGDGRHPQPRPQPGELPTGSQSHQTLGQTLVSHSLLWSLCFLLNSGQTLVSVSVSGVRVSVKC